MYTGKSGNTHGEKKLNIPCKKTVKNEIFILETFIQHISYSRRSPLSPSDHKSLLTHLKIAIRILLFYQSKDVMQASTSFTSAVGSNLATTFPSRSIMNLVKFHLMSGFLSHSGSASANIFSRSALNSCSWNPSNPF